MFWCSDWGWEQIRGQRSCTVRTTVLNCDLMSAHTWIITANNVTAYKCDIIQHVCESSSPYLHLSRLDTELMSSDVLLCVKLKCFFYLMHIYSIIARDSLVHVICLCGLTLKLTGFLKWHHFSPSNQLLMKLNISFNILFRWDVSRLWTKFHVDFFSNVERSMWIKFEKW